MSEVLLEADNVSMHFGGVRAVDGVSFAVERSEIFTIIGPNGAGKSTLFNLINRIYNLAGGRFFFKEQDLADFAPHDIARLGIARTFQNIELFEGATVLQNLLLGRHIHRRSGLFRHALFLPSLAQEEEDHRRRVEDVIDFLDLAVWRDQQIASLPYGVRKIVELGRALATGPELILLDEPSSGLNVEETRDMSFWIRDLRDLLDITVIMVEHDMTLVNAVSDRVLALNQGRMLALGSAQQVQEHKDVQQAYLGDEV